MSRADSLALPSALLGMAGAAGLSYLLVVRPDGARWLAVGTLAALLAALALARPRAAVVAALGWLPFMGLARRVLYILSPYTSFDPLLLVGPAVAGLVASMALIARRGEVEQALRQSGAARLALALLALLLLEVLNPLQGNLSVGLGGALFSVAPLLWFVVGRCYVDRQLAGVLAGVLVAAALLASLYALRQALFGYLPFEQYWLANAGYAALNVGGAIRAVSTFASSGEFVTYATFGLVALTAAVWQQPGWLAPALPLLATIGWAIVTNGTRGAVVRYAAALVVLAALQPRARAAQAAAALAMVALLALGVSQWRYVPGQYQDVPVFGPFLEHQAAGLKDPFGEESTLPAKLEQLRYGVVAGFTAHPLGLGTGAPTLAADKFGGLRAGLENDVSDTFTAGGVAGGVLYLLLTALLARNVLRLWRARRDWLCTALAAGFMVLLGNALLSGFYALPPLWWALMGWVDREHAALQGVAAPAPHLGQPRPKGQDLLHSLPRAMP